LAEKKLTSREINNNLLLATDHEGRTVFHIAVKCGGIELVQKVAQQQHKGLELN